MSFVTTIFWGDKKCLTQYVETHRKQLSMDNNPLDVQLFVVQINMEVTRVILEDMYSLHVISFIITLHLFATYELWMAWKHFMVLY